MLVAYWHKDGIEIYRLLDSKVEKFAVGSMDELRPIKAFGKKILIIGRDMLFYTRKRYPPASDENINKAVQMDIGDLFPLKNPSYFFRIFERTDTYTLADIWAWDCSEYNKLKAVFPFTHLLPEDLAFVSDMPEITILRKRDITYLLSHSRDGFLGVSTFKGSITTQQVEMFMKSLGRYSGDIERMNIYGHSSKVAEGISLQELPIKIEFKEEKGYPVCIDNIGKLNLKEFKAKSERHLLLNMDVALRAVIYLLLAYSLSLYLTGRNYALSIKEINMEMDKLSKDIASINMAQKGVALNDVADELNKKLKGRVLPLSVMEIMAKYLPDKSFIMRMSLNENNLELSLSSKEPLNVIKSLGGAEGIKTVKLKGAPVKDASTGDYNFVLMVEMR